MSEPIHEQMAAAMFAVDWPKDDWSRFKPGDYVRARYVAMAVAAIGCMEARTCATCHAVLAPGPQPAATYAKQPRRDAIP